MTNGVRQGGILSGFLFALYLDDLSCELNTEDIGCYVGNTLLNHLMFADDMFCMAPSRSGLQKLLNICENYGISHDIKFNCDKTFGMLFPTGLYA